MAFRGPVCLKTVSSLSQNKLFISTEGADPLPQSHIYTFMLLQQPGTDKPNADSFAFFMFSSATVGEGEARGFKKLAAICSSKLNAAKSYRLDL